MPTVSSSMQHLSTAFFHFLLSFSDLGPVTLSPEYQSYLRASVTLVSAGVSLYLSIVSPSKMDPKQHSGLPNPTVQYQHVTKGRLSYSSLSVSSGSAELLRGTALKNHLLQHKAGMYSHRSPAATARSDGTCSAFSSPQIPKKEVLRSKDTLDLRTSTLTQKALRDLQLRRNANKNWTFGKYRLRSVDNADQDAACRLSANVHQGQGRGRLLYNKGANGNEISALSSGGVVTFQKDMRHLHNQEMGESEVGVSSEKSKSYQTFNMPRRGSEPRRVTMAAVAPFRFR